MNRPRRWLVFVYVLSMAEWCCSVAVASEAQLVWTDKDAVEVWRSNPDGTEPTLIYSAADGLRDPRGIAVDVATRVMYLADNQTDTIYVGDLNGISPLVPLVTGQLGPADVTLGNGKLYWADQDGNRIRRANLDGTAVETVLSGLNEPYYLTIDPHNDWLYWSDNDSGIVHRARPDGTFPTNLITGLDRVRDIEIDISAGKIYWADRDRSDIRRGNLDGTGIEVLFDASDGLGRPHGLWLDPANHQVYWTDTTLGDVLRGDLNGVGRPQILFNGPSTNGPWELQLVVPEPAMSGIGLATVSTILLLVRRKLR